MAAGRVEVPRVREAAAGAVPEGRVEEPRARDAAGVEGRVEERAAKATCRLTAAAPAAADAGRVDEEEEEEDNNEEEDDDIGFFVCFMDCDEEKMSVYGRRGLALELALELELGVTDGEKEVGSHLHDGSLQRLIIIVMSSNRSSTRSRSSGGGA